MNFAIIRYVLGTVLKVEGVLMCLPALTGILYHEREVAAYFITIIICLVCGLALSFHKPKNFRFYNAEGFVSVSLSWIVLSFFGALPFWISGEIPSLVNAMFESISGFTTTGASILDDVEALSQCNLFWRSFTHWIGGMGVLVFILAVIPMSGGQNMYLMKAESPGPSVEKLVPRVRNTAIILYSIYTAMTVVQIVLLLLCRMPLFEALTTAFGTAGTGGFGVKADSIAGYSPTIQIIVTIFMILFGVNFNAYYLIISRKFRQALHSEEVRTYLGIILVVTLIITVNIRGMFATGGEALRHAAFQVGSIITTTGFSTTDFNLWPQISKSLLLLIMFIGACAGSTGGGIKVSRIVIMTKSVLKELFTQIHPRSIRKVKMDGRTVPHETIRAVNVFLVAYLFICALSVLLIGVDNFDFTTNFSAVAATLNNIGPGLEMVGPMGNFNAFSDFSKWILMFDMLAGRLEIFPMIVLFSPYTWSRNK